MKSQGNQTGRQTGRSAPVRVGVCILTGCLAATPALGLSCARHTTTPSSSDSILTVGFGFGGTALAGALDNFVDQLYSEPLLAIGLNGRPEPRLAVEWQWSDGGRTLRIKLRHGVVFHDGSPLTAGAVAADLRRYLEQPGYGRVASISADGDEYVVVQLREPDAFLLGELSKVTIKTGTNLAIGTGPFVVRSRKPEVVLDSFPKYHLGEPPIRQVAVRTYETPRAAWAAMMRGDVELLYEVNRDAMDFVEAESRIQTFSFPRPYYIPIVFNMKHATLGRREVRQAINEAIDRPEIVRSALHDRGKPADGPIWPYHWAYAATRAYTYNPDAARLRLDAAGLPLKSPGDGQMPRRFRFQCLFWAEDAQYERIALVVQKQLFEIGIDVEMVPMTIREIRERLGSGAFDAILVQMISGRSLDWVYWFWRSVGSNAPAISRSGYTAADAALDRLRAAQSDEETRMAVADLQHVLYEDPPAAFLVRPETARAVDRSFVVPPEAKGRDILGTLWQWRPRALTEARARR